MLKRFLVVLASVSLLATGVFASSDTVQTKKSHTTKHVSAKKHSTQATSAKKASKKTITASKKKSKKSARIA